jgi:hypothetical protein
VCFMSVIPMHPNIMLIIDIRTLTIPMIALP